MTFRFLFFVFLLALCLHVFGLECALAQIDLGGKSMMQELPFISNIASTAQDIMIVAAKVVGAGLAFMSVKAAGQRNWEAAIPGFVGSAGLFFLPQIIAAFSKLAGQ